jgi:hypothetical protein
MREAAISSEYSLTRGHGDRALATLHSIRIARRRYLGKPWLVLGDQVRIEGRLPISRHIQLYPSGVGNHRLLAVAVSAVAGLAVRKTMVYLRVQRPLGQHFLQIVQKAVRIKGRLGISATKKLIKKSIPDLGILASGHGIAPLFPLCPNAQTTPEIQDSPGMRPSLIAFFSPSVLRCLGAAISQESTIWGAHRDIAGAARRRLEPLE